MNIRIIPPAKDFFNKQIPHVCNTLAHLKVYYGVYFVTDIVFYPGLSLLKL
jgi:hypothetical protein